MIRSTVDALGRARLPILLVLATHVAAVIVGAAMVHGGNALALKRRDALVAHARASDPASRALAGGRRLEAAAWDCSRNLMLGAVPSTVGGLSVVLPFVTAAFRGWVGGIVSVDRKHESRLADPAERTYYLVTLLLQIVPYSLAAGAGVRMGLAWFRRRSSAGPLWLGIPREAIADVLRIYAIVVPLFAIASLWEFLMR